MFERFRKLEQNAARLSACRKREPAGRSKRHLLPSAEFACIAGAVICNWIPGIRIIESPALRKHKADQQLREFSTSSHSYKI
jgi:hypothetical protein